MSFHRPLLRFVLTFAVLLTAALSLAALALPAEPVEAAPAALGCGAAAHDARR